MLDSNSVSDTWKRRALSSVILAFAVFAALGIWQFSVFLISPAEDFYQPRGYIRRVNQWIEEDKIYYEPEKTRNGYRPQIKLGKLEPQDQLFFERSWLKDDIRAFNEGDSDVFLIEKGRLKGINIYRHRISSPLASDWNWWGRIYSQSSEGYAYLWNSRRTLKLYRPSSEERASAKVGQSEFREVIF